MNDVGVVCVVEFFLVLGGGVAPFKFATCVAFRFISRGHVVYDLPRDAVRTRGWKILGLIMCGDACRKTQCYYVVKTFMGVAAVWESECWQHERFSGLSPSVTIAMCSRLLVLVLQIGIAMPWFRVHRAGCGLLPLGVKNDP